VTANRAYLGIGTPTAAQNVAQIRSLTRQANGIIAYALGRLDDIAGT
jgi:acyl CoA:acetate/3-ketoacid CoA transferase beta subunit